MSKQASAEDDISCSRKINCCILLKDKQSYIQIPIVIKFPYNAHFDWLKQRTLSENKEQANDIMLAFKFLLRNFDKFDPN